MAILYLLTKRGHGPIVPFDPFWSTWPLKCITWSLCIVSPTVSHITGLWGWSVMRFTWLLYTYDLQHISHDQKTSTAPLDIRPMLYPYLLSTSGSHRWRPVETCSLEDLLPRLPTPPTGTNILWWPPKDVRLASGRYASNWDAVLLTQ